MHISWRTHLIHHSARRWEILSPEMHISSTLSARWLGILSSVCVKLPPFSCKELLPLHHILGILPIAIQCVNHLLGTIFTTHWYIGWLPPAVHDFGKKVITVNTITLSTSLCINLKVCPPVIIFLGRQLFSISTQEKRFLLRHSQLPKDKNYSMPKVVEP